MTFEEITFGIYPTADRAAEALEDAFAEGLICAGERPAIIRRRGRWLIVTRYAIDAEGRYL